MSFAGALILYLIVTIVLFVTFIVVVKRSAIEKKLLGYVVGVIASILWLFCLIVVSGFIWFKKPNKDENKS